MTYVDQSTRIGAFPVSFFARQYGVSERDIRSLMIGREESKPKAPLKVDWQSRIDQAIQETVSETGVEKSVMMSPSRKKRYVEARLVLYRKLRAINLSFPKIGQIVGRDHTSVVQAVNGRHRKSK